MTTQASSFPNPRYRLFIAACMVLAVSSCRHPAVPSVENLRTEYQDNPIGIDARVPRLSWMIRAERRGTMQSAYQVRVATDRDSLSHPLWDSGKVPSDASIQREYQGPPLASGRRYYWQVRIWDDRGGASSWSEPAFWEMGLLNPTDWKARWIVPDLPEDSTTANPSPLLRRAFSLDAPVASARLYVTSLGLNEVEINGQRVGDHLFAPGWTSYSSRLQYETFDVAKLLVRGANAIGATLGDGWYRGALGYKLRRNKYGRRVGLLAQLVVRYADGRTQVITTDQQWKASTGPILMSDIYGGETYDARLEKPGWSRPGYDDSGWRSVELFDRPTTTLVAPQGPPVRRIQEVKPVRIFRTPAGETVLDLGQNMVGRVRLKVRGPRGTVVRLRHAEVLDQAGNFYTKNLRNAAATEQYTLKGDGAEVFEPHFTFHGFRYVAIDGYPGTPTTDAITGVVIHSDLRPTGTFETSNPLVNQLQHNILWAQKGNFLDLPTDCPQRDERLGWTGDAQVFVRTAAFNMEVPGFFAKWLADLAADQRPNGSVPSIIPDVPSPTPDQSSSTGWGDAAVVVPWEVYQAYGDLRLLERQYPSMRAWVEYSRTQADSDLVWRAGTHYGDWLDFASTLPKDSLPTTAQSLISTAYFARSTKLLAQSAEVLGKAAEARRYRELFDAIKAAFNREFVTSTGRLSSTTQTAYALALAFDLLPEAVRPQAARWLAEEVRTRHHLTTGFLGTPVLTQALSDNGYVDEAYALLLNEEYPSWLYPVKHGATTIWERWDGQKPDGTFQDADMNSFNHYAYGAVGGWMYRVVAGLNIDPDAPGYKHVLIQPRPGGGMRSARAALQTQYGEVVSEWRLVGNALQVTIRIPPNTHATVRLPGARLAAVSEGGRPATSVEGVTHATQEGDLVAMEVGSGSYTFAYGAPTLAEHLRKHATPWASGRQPARD